VQSRSFCRRPNSPPGLNPGGLSFAPTLPRGVLLVRDDNFRFATGEPELSLKPSILTVMSGYARMIAATLFSWSSDPGWRGADAIQKAGNRSDPPP